MKLVLFALILNGVNCCSAQINVHHLTSKLNDFAKPEKFNPNDVSKFPGFDALKFDGKYYNPFSYEIVDILTRFEKRYNKSYSESEIMVRKANLISTLDSIGRHILYAFNNGSTFNVSLNRFSDWSDIEMIKLLGTLEPILPLKLNTVNMKINTVNVNNIVKINIGKVNNSESVNSTLNTTSEILSELECVSNSNDTLPLTLDYRQKKMVTTVKNQLHCGSCWAFASIATIESQWAKITSKKIDLSENDLVNCASTHGCSGEYMDKAFEYVIKHGVARESQVSYKAKVSECRHYPLKKGVVIDSYCHKRDTENGIPEEEIMRDVRDVGPVAVVINARKLLKGSYSSGIFDHHDCPREPNHAVVIVGWGEDNGVKYWIVKNSWGTAWGERGYFRIVRGKNMCQINDWLYYPTLTNAEFIDKLS